MKRLFCFVLFSLVSASGWCGFFSAGGGSTGDVSSTGNNDFTGNNTHTGTETFQLIRSSAQAGNPIIIGPGSTVAGDVGDPTAGGSFVILSIAGSSNNAGFEFFRGTSQRATLSFAGSTDNLTLKTNFGNATLQSPNGGSTIINSNSVNMITAAQAGVTISTNVTVSLGAKFTGLPGPDGWIADGNTWTGLGTSSLTINANMTAILGPGDVISLVQSATTKYFYVSSATFTVGVSTITIDPTSDYTLAAGAATTPRYAHTPANGFPDWLNYTPSTTTGFTGALPSATYRYKESGRTVFVELLTTAGGTSNTATYNVSLPVTSAAASAGVGGFGPGLGAAACLDNSAAINTGMWNVVGSTNTVQLIKALATTAWTTSGTKGCSASFFYER